MKTIFFVIAMAFSTIGFAANKMSYKCQVVGMNFDSSNKAVVTINPGVSSDEIGDEITQENDNTYSAISIHVDSNLDKNEINLRIMDIEFQKIPVGDSGMWRGEELKVNHMWKSEPAVLGTSIVKINVPELDLEVSCNLVN